MVTLPSRTDRGSGRPRRGVRLPGVEHVAQAPLAPDPGVAAPKGAFAAPLAAASDALSDVSDTVRVAAERQQKRFDATGTAEAQLAHDDTLSREYQRRLVEDDPSRPDFMADFEKFVGVRQLPDGGFEVAGKTAEILNALPEGISADAKERLRLRLIQNGLRMVDSAGRLSIDAGQKKAVDTIQGLTNKWSQQAAANPDFLIGILKDADDSLAEFNGALTADAERDTRAASRETIIRSAVEGLLVQKRYDDAAAFLKIEAFDEDLTRATRSALETKIESARSSGMKVERARVNDLIGADIASRAATGEGVRELSEDRIRAAFGGGEAGDFAAEQYRDKRKLADATFAASTRLRGASPEEGAAIVASAMPQAGDPDFDDKAKMASALKAEWQRQVELRQSDPATAAMQIPEVAAMFAIPEGSGNPDMNPPAELLAGLRQRMEVQRDLGVINPRLLQKDQAKRMVEAIEAAKPEDKFATFVQLKEGYGDLYPTLIREMGLKAYGGLDVRMGLVAGLTREPALAREYLTAIANADEAKKGLGRGEVTDLEAKVRDGMGALYTAATAGNADPSNIARVDGIASGVTALAIQRMRQGRGLGDAAESAVEDMIESRFHLADTWFAPREINGRPVNVGKVEVAMERARTESAIRDFGISPRRSLGTDPGEEARTDAIVSAAVNNGFWVTNETGTGAYLAFTRADGLLVTFRNAANERYEIDFLDATRSAGKPVIRRGTSGDIRRQSRDMFRRMEQ